jgi:hypothetical protein
LSLAPRWTYVGSGPVAPRSDHFAVWSGDRVLIWGGANPSETRLADGGCYMPATGEWGSLPAAPLSGRTGASVMWLRDRLIIWGGFADGHQDRTEGGLVPLGDGAYYIPQTRCWSPTPTSPLSPRGSHIAFASGGRMILWGGMRESGARCRDGATLDPLSNEWALVPPCPISAHTAQERVWTGATLIVWASSDQGLHAPGSLSLIGPASGRRPELGGNQQPSHPRASTSPLISDSIATFTPADDRWQRITNGPGLPLVVWATSIDNKVALVSPNGKALLWRPSDGSCSTLPPLPRLHPETRCVAYRDKLVILGESEIDHGSALSGWWYDLSRGKWESLPASPLSPRWGFSATPIDSGLFIWGGRSRSDAGDGAVLTFAN